MSEWLPIRYLGFWDVPRNFLVRYQRELYLFDCPFREELDDYPDSYAVYVLPDLSADEIDADWAALPGKAVRKVGDIPITDVRFDPTRRKAIGAEVFDALVPDSSANGEHSHAKPRSPAR
jgi:hypothetical protein